MLSWNTDNTLDSINIGTPVDIPIVKCAAAADNILNSKIVREPVGDKKLRTDLQSHYKKKCNNYL